MELMKIVGLVIAIIIILLEATLLVLWINIHLNLKKEKPKIKKRYTKKDEKRIKEELWQKYKNDNKGE